MQATFYVSNDKVNETKELVRKYPSMRYLSNPLPLWDNYEFRVESHISDMEAFMYQRYIRELEGGLTKRANDGVCAHEWEQNSWHGTRCKKCHIPKSPRV